MNKADNIKKMTETRSKNMRELAKKVQAIVWEHYEPGRQDRSKLWCYRNHVKKVYPISEREFWRLMSIDTSESKE